MRDRFVTCALLALAAASAVPAAPPAAADRPGVVAKDAPPPEGFRWHDHAATRSRFPVPNGWKVQESKVGDVVQITISPKPVPEGSTALQTAFTIHVFATPEHRKQDGMARVKGWIDGLRTLKEARVETAPKTIAPMDAIQVMAVAPLPISAETPAFRLMGLGVVNRDTGAHYIARFEVPETEFEKYGQIGSRIVARMVLETEF